MKNDLTAFIIAIIVAVLSIAKNPQQLLNQKKAPLTPTPTIMTRLSHDTYIVTKIVDGDTIKVEIGGETKTIRLLGINTPETKDPRKKVECFGKEASQKTTDLLTGKSVRLENDPSQGDVDKYGRLLRYVYLEDGTFINKLLINEGYAFEYTYSIPYKYREDFKQAQKNAESQEKGLWAKNACSN